MVDQNDLLRPEETLADGQGSDLIGGYHATCITYDVRLACLQPEHPVHVHARIHAGNYRKLARWREGERAGKGFCIELIVCDEFVCGGHRCLS